MFASVIVVTDRTVLDAQLQETISGFDHTLGAVEAIGEDKNSGDLRDAINNGARIIITTLQKFPVIYTEVNKTAGKNKCGKGGGCRPGTRCRTVPAWRLLGWR